MNRSTGLNNLSHSNIAIQQDDLADGNIIRLLQAHRREMLKHSPPDSVYALTTRQLTAPEMQFWSAWVDVNGQPAFAGCGALKDLGGGHAELKSMKTKTQYLRKGVAQTLLEHIITAATHQGFTRLSLETGVQEVFEPAKKLYQRNGFDFCGPFADYTENPFSDFMTRRLSE